MTERCAAIQKLEVRIDNVGSLLCVGLDPELSRIPERFHQERYPLYAFCREVIEATAPFACAFKPNTAFFEAHGSKGWEQLEQVFAFLRESHPDVFTICDAKRADLGNTNRGYVAAVFDGFGADAITVQPYLGAEALAPFLERGDRASVVLCRTSNSGAGELQDLLCEGKPIWRHVAERVSRDWNTRGNCMLVVGATWPEEMQAIRDAAPDLTFLVPGIGAQGGDLEAVVRAGLRSDGKGLIISSSRAILYAESPSSAARETRDEILRIKERLYAGQ